MTHDMLIAGAIFETFISFSIIFQLIVIKKRGIDKKDFDAYSLWLGLFFWAIFTALTLIAQLVFIFVFKIKDSFLERNFFSQSISLIVLSLGMLFLTYWLPFLKGRNN
jgi:succinate-acetate transporter protein